MVLARPTEARLPDAKKRIQRWSKAGESDGLSLDTQEQLARQHRFRFHFLPDADHAFKLASPPPSGSSIPICSALISTAAVLNDNLNSMRCSTMPKINPLLRCFGLAASCCFPRLTPRSATLSIRLIKDAPDAGSDSSDTAPQRLPRLSRQLSAITLRQRTRHGRRSKPSHPGRICAEVCRVAPHARRGRRCRPVFLTVRRSAARHCRSPPRARVPIAASPPTSLPYRNGISFRAAISTRSSPSSPMPLPTRKATATIEAPSCQRADLSPAFIRRRSGPTACWQRGFVYAFIGATRGAKRAIALHDRRAGRSVPIAMPCSASTASRKVASCILSARIPTISACASSAPTANGSIQILENDELYFIVGQIAIDRHFDEIRHGVALDRRRRSRHRRHLGGVFSRRRGIVQYPNGRSRQAFAPAHRVARQSVRPALLIRSSTRRTRPNCSSRRRRIPRRNGRQFDGLETRRVFQSISTTPRCAGQALSR